MPTVDRRPTKFRPALSGGRNQGKPTFALQPVMDSAVLMLVAACCGTNTGLGTFFASARRCFIPVALSANGSKGDLRTRLI